MQRRFNTSPRDVLNVARSQGFCIVSRRIRELRLAISALLFHPLFRTGDSSSDVLLEESRSHAGSPLWSNEPRPPLVTLALSIVSTGFAVSH